MAINSSGYLPGGNSSGAPSGAPSDSMETDDSGYWTLEQCVRAYTTYLDSKQPEISEQQMARRYRHCVQWTAEQIKVLNDRKQPVVTYNRLGRKIDGIVGLVEKLRQDPKAYPRTPQHQAGADLATACLRYIMDNNQWQDKKALVAELAAVDGIGGVELDLRATSQQAPQGQPDYDVMFNVVDNDGYFYDPRSFKHDFSDARFQGAGKWVDEELLKEMMPDKTDEISSAINGATLTSNSDRDVRWFQDNGKFKQVRLVDIWYKHKGGWCWALFTAGAKLMEGQSPFVDDKGKQLCKYVMFSAQVDHEGDRYGFPRNLYGAADEINQRRSKALYELNSRRIRATRAAIADDDVEKLRREASRADGIVLSNTQIDEIQFDDAAKQQAIMGHLEFLKEAKAEIENFGPNPALLGSSGIAGNSGRAIALMQQAGIAELGPYMLNLRAWTIRLYRGLFQAAQKHWTAERWIRVTDDEGLQQFVAINQMDMNTGAIVNAIGQLDVDIILDEGPDTITMMADTYEALSQALPSVSKILSPTLAQAALEVLIETSPLPADVKKKFRDAGQQAQQEKQQQGPPPEVQAKMAELQMKQKEGEQNLALKGQEMAMNHQAKQQEAAVNSQIRQRESADKMQIAQFEAEKKMEIAQFEAQTKAAIAGRVAAAQIAAGADADADA